MKKINKDERINGAENTHIILYSDDYDNIMNSEFNTKVFMLTFWRGTMYFPGGSVFDKNMSLEDTLSYYLNVLMSFDLEKHKENMVHISSYKLDETDGIEGEMAIHTYALKIEKSDMRKLKLNEPELDEEGNAKKGFEVLLDSFGMNKLTIGLNTLSMLLNITFEPTVKETLLNFVELYIDEKIQLEKELQENIKIQNQQKHIQDKVKENPEMFKEGLKSILSEKGLDYLLDKEDPRSQKLMDENGCFKDEELDKIFLSEDSIMSELGVNKEPVMVSPVKVKVDFSQNKW